MVFNKILAIHENWGHFLTIKGKKVGGNGSKKVCPKWVTPYLAYPHEKYCFLKWLRCTKKYHKIWIFGHFCDFGKKSQKRLKICFFFRKVEIFWHTLIIWENCTFSFSTLFDLLKKWVKIKINTFVHGQFLSFLAKKCQKYQFSWKIPFLRFVLWVILDQLAWKNCN